jgi:hypothetical protein
LLTLSLMLLAIADIGVRTATAEAGDDQVTLAITISALSRQPNLSRWRWS